MLGSQCLVTYFEGAFEMAFVSAQVIQGGVLAASTTFAAAVINEHVVACLCGCPPPGAICYTSRFQSTVPRRSADEHAVPCAAAACMCGCPSRCC